MHIYVFVFGFLRLVTYNFSCMVMGMLDFILVEGVWSGKFQDIGFMDSVKCVNKFKLRFIRK